MSVHGVWPTLFSFVLVVTYRVAEGVYELAPRSAAAWWWRHGFRRVYRARRRLDGRLFTISIVWRTFHLRWGEQEIVSVPAPLLLACPFILTVAAWAVWRLEWLP